MAATRSLPTVGALSSKTRPKPEEEESMATMRAMLQAMTWASQAKDVALEDLQRRLNSALQDVEQGLKREAALLVRAERSEKAEEVLASEMAEVEAEAFARITEANKQMAAISAPFDPTTIPDSFIQIANLQRRLQAAVEESAALARRCEVLGREVELGRVRESALRPRLTMAEEAEEAVVSQVAEVITENAKKLAETGSIVASTSQGADVPGVEEALEEVKAKLCEAEEKNKRLEERLAELEKGGEDAVVVRRKKQTGGGGARLAEEEALFSVSLQDVARFVKLNLWNSPCLTVVPTPS